MFFIFVSLLKEFVIFPQFHVALTFDESVFPGIIQGSEFKIYTNRMVFEINCYAESQIERYICHYHFILQIELLIFFFIMKSFILVKCGSYC